MLRGENASDLHWLQSQKGDIYGQAHGERVDTGSRPYFSCLYMGPNPLFLLPSREVKGHKKYGILNLVLSSGIPLDEALAGPHNYLGHCEKTHIVSLT